MQISTIDEFILLAEKLNFTEAAGILFISQPTLSKHISDLEKELGVSLLYRNKHGVELTEAGKIVYERFKVIRDDFSDLEKQLKKYQLDSSGLLRFGFLYYFVDEYVNPILKRLNSDIPYLSPQLFYYQPLPLIRALENDELDIGITYHYQYENAGQFEFFDFSKEAPLLFAGRNHPLTVRNAVSLSELKNEVFVSLRSKPYLNHVLHILKNAGIEAPQIAYCDQIDALDFVLNQTRGVSIMPCSVRNMGRKNLCSIPVSDEDPYFRVCAVYKRSNQNPLIPVVIKTIKRIFHC